MVYARGSNVEPRQTMPGWIAPKVNHAYGPGATARSLPGTLSATPPQRQDTLACECGSAFDTSRVHHGILGISEDPTWLKLVWYAQRSLHTKPG